MAMEPTVDYNLSSLLIVDDDQSNNLLMVHMARGLADRIDRAYNGHQALQLASQHPYPVIVMDVHMPGMNGLDAIKELKQQNHSARIIIVTVDDSAETLERCRDIGATACLLKPFDRATLASAIARAQIG